MKGLALRLNKRLDRMSHESCTVSGKSRGIVSISSYPPPPPSVAARPRPAALSPPLSESVVTVDRLLPIFQCRQSSGSPNAFGPAARIGCERSIVPNFSFVGCPAFRSPWLLSIGLPPSRLPQAVVAPLRKHQHPLPPLPTSGKDSFMAECRSSLPAPLISWPSSQQLILHGAGICHNQGPLYSSSR